MDPWTQQDLLEAGKDDCQNTTKTAGPSSSPNGIQRYQPSKSVTRKIGEEMGRRPRDLLTTKQTHQRQQRSHERHGLAHFGERLPEIGLSGIVSTRLKQPTRPTTPITSTAATQPTMHDLTTSTTEAHDRNENVTKDDDDTSLIFSQLINSLNPRNTKATTSNTLSSKATTRVSHDTLILSEPHLPFQHRCRTTSFQAARDQSGTSSLTISLR